MTARFNASRRVKRASFLSSLTGVVAILSGALAALGQVSTAGAVDGTGMFEMDGNIAQDAAAAPPYDWASLFDASGHRLVTPDAVNGPLLASQFLSDAATPDASYFSSNGAGVKDIDTLSKWGCTSLNNPLDKDDLKNAYAALIQVPANAVENAGDTVLFLGSERGSNNGTSFAGFWLFKDKSVGCNTATGDFNGAHQVGDLLVVSDFTNGGGTQDVSVYKWVGGANPLSLVLSGGVCPNPPTATGDSACAIANSLNNPDTPISSPWAPTSHPGNTFVEAAIDLNSLFATEGGGTCFTTFMAETRSSDQLTATLKDFTGGQLNTCFAPPMVTTATPGGSTVLPGAAQHDVATISGAPGKAAPTGTISFTLCGPSEVDSTGCPAGKGTQVGTAEPISNGGASSDDVNGLSSPDDLGLGKYCWRSDYTPDANSTNLYDPSTHTNATSECFTVVKASTSLTTEIGVTGNGGAAATTLGDTATLHGFTGTVTGETITFDLFGPYASGVTPTCATGTNEPVFTTTGTLNASGLASTGTTFQPPTAGQYVWVAHYGGDAVNSSADGACTDAHESTTITPPVIHVTKSADAASVSAGTPIGYTVTVSNSGTGTATGLTLTDALPGGNAATPVHWVIDTTTGDFGSFSISGADGSQQLTLAGQPVTLAAAGSLTVHILAATTPQSCAVYDNNAEVEAGNGAGDKVGPIEITVQCPDLSILKTAVPAGPVSTGQSIGFTIAVSNSSAPGTGTASTVTMDDPLPAGHGINWSISPAYTGPGSCAITGAVGSQKLDCSFGDMLPGASITVAIASPTTGSSAGHYDNTATAEAANNPAVDSTAGVTVLAPGLNITKTADADSVASGAAIGFTVTVTNAGPGTATVAALSDPLPSATGVSWSISPAYSGQGSCTVTSGSSGQTLACDLGDMAAGASVSVHVTSATTTASCGSFPNTATASASNQDPVQASATTSVICSQVQGIVSVPNTGGDPGARGGALGLIAGGLMLLLAGAGLRRRAVRNSAAR